MGTGVIFLVENLTWNILEELMVKKNKKKNINHTFVVHTNNQKTDSIRPNSWGGTKTRFSFKGDINDIIWRKDCIIIPVDYENSKDKIIIPITNIEYIEGNVIEENTEED
jgi:hypothetical protein